MAKVNFNELIPNLQKVLDAVEALTPLAAEIGGPVVANVATMAIAATATIQNVLERAEDLKKALSTHDVAKLEAMLADIQRANDALATAVSES